MHQTAQVNCLTTKTVRRSRVILCLALLLGVAGLSAQEAERLQRPNLPEGPKVAKRFETTDRVWPEKPGEMGICLWKDDKVAAVSVTVDDNYAPDVPWWFEMSDTYGFPVTWFVITRNIKDDGNAFGGTWKLWQSVLDKGHDVQSHTHTHLHVDDDDWQDIEWEYRESKRLIEEKLPGHRARFLAYPGGKHSDKNDREVAGRYYAGARGVTGVIPDVNSLDYMGTRCGSGGALDNPKASWADPRNILTPSHRAYRSWCILLYHFMKEKPENNPFFEFLKENSDVLWLARFGDVSLYGQERDTATLKTVANTSEGIAFDLSDEMDDQAFDYPLTIKLRLYDEWQNVVATQGEKAVEARVVEHEGARFALVQAVPDRGTVRLTPRL